MGSSSEEPNKSIDASVGGLVWVRRRNGSWWPGRILGPDELPEGCLPTPRSGTPVKLLGREDASVDWYNLEKSKRVKAFRCGEYDSCIEKAKASAFNLSKKTVKYARREDAILRALELESARLGKDSPDFYARPDQQAGEHHHVYESPSSFHPSEESEGVHLDVISSEDDSDSAQELSQSGVSFEEPDHLDANKEKSKRWRTPNDSEDDGTEGVKRMRGLEDLGMGVSSSLKRKRSQVAHVHEFLKRKNRRRTLTKVLECTVMVSDPVCEKPTELSVPGASDNKVSRLESNESKKNNSAVITNNSDSTGVSCENGTSLNASKPATDSSLRYKQKENEISSMVEVPNYETSKRFFDAPLVVKEKHSAGLSGAPLKAHGGAGAQSSQSSHVDTISLGNEEHNESGSTSSGTADMHNMSQRIETGTSEWQLKGKRNSRSRKIDANDEAETYLAATDREGNCGWSWIARNRESRTRGSTTELPVPQRLLPLRQSRFTVNPKYDSSDFSLRHHIVGTGLFDVPVEVKSSYRPQHVPYISLMSKLHGHPITGHPLTIEVLDDGFCNDTISTFECHSSSSELECKLNASGSTHLDMVYERKQRGRPSSKPRTCSRKKSQKSRKNGLLSKKIRKLSSLTSSHRQNQEGKKKPVAAKLRGPSIACVPLMVVFSRINAALNSSTRPAPRLTTTSNI